MKRIISILLAACMAATVIYIGALPAGAADAVPAGYTPIYTPEDLDAVRNNLSGKYILMNDINMARWGNWDPIGIDEWEDRSYDSEYEFNWWRPSFTGVFDGNGYAIRNLTCVNELSAAGLFAAIREVGVVKNVRLVNAAVKSAGVSGGIAANIINGAVIANCSVSGSVTATYKEWFITVAGGIAGIAVGGDTVEEGARIRGCHNAATVTAPTQAGGILGGTTSGSDIIEAKSAYATISRCSNRGTVHVIFKRDTKAEPITIRAGGILGGGDASIINCYNTGAITGSTYYKLYVCLGGIAGSTGSVGKIGGCYNTGKVLLKPSHPCATKEIGAIIGSDSRAFDDSVNLTACYYLGGLPAVGWSRSSDHYGEPYEPVYTGVKALHRGEMALECSFKGFDFENVWEMKWGRPVLRADIGDALTDPLPVVPDPFWATLPDWQQFILRWFCFGWAWME